MLQITKVADCDINDFGFIHSVAWHATYKNIASEDFLSQFTPQNRAAVFKKAIKNPNERFYIAKLNNKPIGILILDCHPKDEDEYVGEVKALYLLPDYQGKGYGTEMMNFAIGDFTSLKKTKVILWVLEKNLKARHFYEKYGFRFDGRINIGNDEIEMKYCLNLLKDYSCFNNDKLTEK